MYRYIARLTRRAALGLVALGTLCKPAAALPINQVQMVRDLFHFQTGNGPTLSLTQTHFQTVVVGTFGPVSNATLTFPGPSSPVVLTYVPGTTNNWFVAQDFFGPTSKAAMDAAFPTGVYQYTMNYAAPAVATLDYIADNYPSLPYLSGNSYSSLQNLNPANSLSISFSDYIPAAGASSCNVFFHINPTANPGMTAFNFLLSGCTPSTSLAALLSASTLAPNTNYSYILSYQAHVPVSGTGSDFGTEIVFQQNTFGIFRTAAATAVPEPSTLWCVLVGLLGLGCARRVQRNA